MKNIEEQLQKQFSEEQQRQLKQIANFAASRYVLPLFALFSVADYVYYHSLFIEFTIYRLFTIVSIVVLNAVIKRTKTLLTTQIWASIFILACSLPLNIMLLRIEDSGSPYYAGLCLVIIGMASGFRFTWPFYSLNLGLIIIPFFILLPISSGVRSTNFLLSCFFLIGNALIMSVSRYFNEQLTTSEFRNRISLQNEVISRNEVIETKTQEALRLSQLSKQFSPQVVHAINVGDLDLNKPVHRSEIAVIFVDVVGSTDRFIRLDREDLNIILSNFMEDTMGVLLKYDITIDKFLGDGVLAFANDPIKHTDYLERSLIAALEIKKKISNKNSFYSELWLSDFDIRIGISSGFSSVGFYGSEHYLKSYTAIGRPVNLATRLTSASGPGQILVSQDVLTKLSRNPGDSNFDFSFNQVKVPPLKGFETEKIKVYELTGASDLQSLLKESHGSNGPAICPHGHGLLNLEKNQKGIYVFQCRTCKFVLDENAKKKKVA